MPILPPPGSATALATSTAVPSPSAQAPISPTAPHSVPTTTLYLCFWPSGGAGVGRPQRPTTASPASADPLESSARFPAAPADPIRCLGRKPEAKNAAEARYTPIQSWAPRRATAVQGAAARRSYRVTVTPQPPTPRQKHDTDRETTTASGQRLAPREREREREIPIN